MIINNFNTGGGGGSYTLPVASQSTLGGVKVGEGLSITSGGTLSVSGGSSAENNYVIVNTLSEISNPVEGMLAYEHSGQTTAEWEGWVFHASGISEDFVAILSGYGQEEEVKIYKSGDNFHWNYENDGELHKMEGASGHMYWYKAEGGEEGSGDFYLYAADTAELSLTRLECESGESSETVVTNSWTAGSYLYDGNNWNQTSDEFYIVDRMTSGEVAELATKMVSNTDDQNTALHIYYQGCKCTYYTKGSNFAALSKSAIETGSGYPYLNCAIFWLQTSGQIYWEKQNQHYAVPINFNVDIASTAYTMTNSTCSKWAACRAASAGLLDLSINLYSGDTNLGIVSNWATIVNSNAYDAGKMIAEFEVSGDTVRGEWDLFDDGATNTKWEVQSSGGVNPMLDFSQPLSWSQITSDTGLATEVLAYVSSGYAITIKDDTHNSFDHDVIALPEYLGINQDNWAMWRSLAKHDNGDVVQIAYRLNTNLSSEMEPV